MTRIVSAAIRVGDMIASMPAPARHGHVLRPLCELNNEICVQPEDYGFLTDAGKFVDRGEAKRIAREAGQLLPRCSPRDELFSEDVW